MGEAFEWGRMEDEDDLLDEMENDLRDLNLDLERTITTGLKTAEEIERLTVDEKLNDVDRALYLLSSGQDVQRISVVRDLAKLIRENQVEGMRKVVPKVREVLHLSCQELQEAATVAFVQIAEDKSIPPQLYAQTFLQTILQNIDSRDPDISESWLSVLLQVIKFLPKEIIKRDILSIAIAKGQLNQSVQSRLASCQIIGKVATRFDSFMIKKDVLPLVTALCQDVDYEVRACMCKELAVVARGLGLEPTQSAILPELVELSNDEESCVRLSALETIVNLLSLLDDETCNQTIIPLVCKYCDNAMQNKDVTLPSIAKQFGKLCHGLSVNLTEEQKIWSLNYYRDLCIFGLHEKPTPEEAMPEPPTAVSSSSESLDITEESPRIQALYKEEERQRECRHQSAFNLPCMVLFAGAKNFKSELHSSFASLCDDPEEQVRISLAKGFHEVSKLLGSSVHIIQGEFINILRDDSLEVVAALVSHLPETCEAFIKGFAKNDSKQDNCFSDVIPALLSAESRAAASRNWRLHSDILDKFSCLAKCLTSDQIYHKFVPVVFHCITSHKPLPVHLAACRTICVFIKYNRKQEQRQELCSQLIEECRNHQSSRYRRLFLDVCVYLMEVFSKSFFNEHFFEKVLELAEDPIANVRLRCCTLLPMLKTQLKLPKDRQLLQQLDLVVRKLLVMEKDRDVTAAIRQAACDMDKVQVAVQSLTAKQYFEEDFLDQKKEEEERSLLQAEEKEKERTANPVPSSAKSTSSERRRTDTKTDKMERTIGSASSTTSNTTRKASRLKAVSSTGRKTSASPTGPPSHTANRAASKSMKSKKPESSHLNDSHSNATTPTRIPSKANSSAGKKSPLETNNNKPSAIRRRAGSDGLLAAVSMRYSPQATTDRLKKKETSSPSSTEVRRASAGNVTHDKKSPLQPRRVSGGTLESTRKSSSADVTRKPSGGSIPQPRMTKTSSLRSSTHNTTPKVRRAAKP
ncbi:serine/threonine-protein phosphatase 4 regulatory subunit 4-like isoform X3 [Apostichopus japonicus]|uniref:serine/threonine-protein phosphatase 4 regulatory subunit 4-like isoform X3 n=1 Tax=Stichopus japonicus TaxID=307972 RepID=UPI003AB1D4D3